jgi:DNA-binding IclR family transcriptional regulator
VTVSMLSRSLGVSRATCRRKLATLIEWGFIKRERQTYRIVAWMGEVDQRRMLNRITAILNHATTEMTLAKLATSVAHLIAPTAIGATGSANLTTPIDYREWRLGVSLL